MIIACIFRASCVALLLAMLWVMYLPVVTVALAQQKSAAEQHSTDVSVLVERMEKLERELEKYREVEQVRREGMEKIQEERGKSMDGRLQLQEGRIGDTGRSVDMFALLITILLGAGGFLTYREAGKEARKQAKEQAQAWLDEERENIIANIQRGLMDVESRAREVKDSIDRVEEDVKQRHCDFNDAVQMLKKSFERTMQAHDGDVNIDGVEQECRVVDVVGRDLKDIPESKYTADHLYAKGITEYYSGRKESALDYFAQAAAFVGASDEIAAKALFAKAVSLRDAGRYAEELAGYDEIDRRFGNSPDLGAQREVASSLVNKGLGFVREGRKEDALAAYAEVVRRYGSSSDPAIQEKVAMALVNTGAHHGGEGRLEEALAAYEDVVHRFGGFDDRAVQERVALALFNKGIALEGAGRLQEGLAAYEEIDRRYGTSPDPGIREQVAMALVCRGRALGRKVSLRQAIAAYDEVDRRFGSATESGIQKLVVLALVNKGMALGNIGKDKDELAVFDEVERRFGVCSSPEVQRHVATARNGIGCDRLIQAKVLWKDVTQRTEALNSALEALDRALPHTTDKDMVLGNRAYTLFLLGRFEEARESMRQALLLGGKHRYTCEAEVAELTTVPEDADFLRFLADTWREVHGTEPPGFPGVGEAAPA